MLILNFFTLLSIRPYKVLKKSFTSNDYESLTGYTDLYENIVVLIKKKMFLYKANTLEKNN